MVNSGCIGFALVKNQLFKTIAVHSTPLRIMHAYEICVLPGERHYDLYGCDLQYTNLLYFIVFTLIGKGILNVFTTLQNIQFLQ